MKQSVIKIILGIFFLSNWLCLLKFCALEKTVRKESRPPEIITGLVSCINMVNDGQIYAALDYNLAILKRDSNGYYIAEYHPTPFKAKHFIDAFDQLYAITETKTHLDSTLRVNFPDITFKFRHGIEIYLTKNWGQSWDLLDIIPGYLSSHQVYRNMLIINTNLKGSVFCSQDRGSSWQPEQIGIPDSTEVGPLFQDSKGTIYAVIDQKLYKSRGDRLRWRPLVKLPANPLYLYYHKGLNSLYMLDEQKKLRQTRDWGRTWQIRGDFKTFQGQELDLMGLTADSAGNIYLAVRPGGVLSNYASDQFTVLDKTLSRYVITKMGVNAENQLILGTASHGLLQWSPDKGLGPVKYLPDQSGNMH